MFDVFDFYNSIAVVVVGVDTLFLFIVMMVSDFCGFVCDDVSMIDFLDDFNVRTIIGIIDVCSRFWEGWSCYSLRVFDIQRLFNEIGLDGKQVKNIITNEEFSWENSLSINSKGVLLLTTKI